MAVKKTVNDIVTVYRLINSAKVGKMEDAEKISLIKAIRHLKKVGVDFDDFLKDAQERLKVEGFDAIVSKVQEKKGLTPEETATLNKYNKNVENCIKEETEKEVELDFEPLSDEAINRLVASNDFSVGEIMSIFDMLGK